MIFGFYLFGTRNGKYDQYPKDTKSLLFKAFSKNRFDASQLHIYRDGQLVYYAFLHDLLQGKTEDYVGICLIFNSVYCRNIQNLFSVFQDTLLAESSKKEALLKTDGCGNFSFACDALYKNQAGINDIKAAFQKNIHRISADFQSFDERFEIGNDSFKKMSLKDGNEAVNNRINKYKQIVITPTESCSVEKRKTQNKSLLPLIVSGIIGVIGIIAVTFFIPGTKPFADDNRQNREFQATSAKALEFFESAQTKDANYYSEALQFCEEALAIDPENQEMQELKSEIEVRIKERDEKKGHIARKNAREYFEFAQKTDSNYYSEALRFCEEALTIDPEDKEMKNLKQKIEKLIHQ